MAIACPVDLDTLRLRAEIQSIYARVATEPSGDFHFHRGPAYAAGMLGYDANALAALPADTTASFAGVANPHRVAPITTAATVVDIGCGARYGLTACRSGGRAGGRAIGVDITELMAERARVGARATGLDNVEVRIGDALALPVESETVDFVISNGVLNLTPDKRHHRRPRAIGIHSTEHRPLDGLNCWRSAGGRAHCAPREDRFSRPAAARSEHDPEQPDVRTILTSADPRIMQFALKYQF